MSAWTALSAASDGVAGGDRACVEGGVLDAVVTGAETGPDHALT